MLALFVALTVAAAPAAESHKFSLAAPGLSYSGIDQDTGDLFLDYFTQQLGVKGGIAVSSPNEVAKLIGTQKQKELLSCVETGGPCFTDVAGTLKADGVITGSISKLSSGLAASFRILSPVTGQPMAIYSKHDASEEGMLVFLEKSADDFATQMHMANDKPITLAEQKPILDTSYEHPVTRTGPTKLWIVPAVLGTAAFGAAGYEYYLASTTNDRLRTGDRDVTDVASLDRLVATGKQQQQYSAIAAGAGLFCFGVMTAILLASGTDEPRPTLSMSVSAHGAGFVFEGALP
ncbi:MAG: hypothetical protein ACJ790_20645 [Myxococcaceae bacterium]